MLALQVIISFIVGGLFIALQTLIAERVPKIWRGVALTAPSTLALGILFIGLTKNPSDVTEATVIIPAGLVIDYLYVLVFAALIRFGLAVSILGSLAAWAIFAGVLLKFPPSDFSSSVFLYSALPIIIFYLIARTFSQNINLKEYPLNLKHIVVRSLIGGTIIGIIVTLANTLGNIWGGLFSTFPAAFTSTFIIYYYLQGKKAIPSVAQSLFFPGSIGFILYTWIAAIAFPKFGVWIGTLLSYLATFAFFWVWIMLQKPKNAKIKV